MLVRAVADFHWVNTYVDSIGTDDEIGNVFGSIFEDDLALVCILDPIRLAISVA